MILDYNTTHYVMSVQGALEDGDRIDPKYLTDRCPECLGRVTWLDTGNHLVVPVKEYPTHPFRVQANDWDVYVVIGCEGYWVVNPESVGVPSRTWQDWTDPNN